MDLRNAPIAPGRLLRSSLFHREKPGKIERLLSPNSCREVDQADNLCYIKLVNTWIILNCGGGPTPDKPELFLEIPSDLNRVSTSLICASPTSEPATKNGATAFFLTEPLPNPDGWEWRCYMRDPDGYIIEVGQYTQLALDWFNSRS